MFVSISVVAAIVPWLFFAGNLRRELVALGVIQAVPLLAATAAIIFWFLLASD
jgi:hypothetical protein